MFDDKLKLEPNRTIQMYKVSYSINRGFSVKEFPVNIGYNKYICINKDDAPNNYDGEYPSIPRELIGKVMSSALEKNIYYCYLLDVSEIKEVKSELYSLATEQLIAQLEESERLLEKHGTHKEVTPSETTDKLAKAYSLANNAIYFNDSSDYLPYLYSIAKLFNTDVDSIGKKYIE